LSILTFLTATAPNSASEPLGGDTRAGTYSNQAWLAATLTVWPGCGSAARLDDALPALPREFVIVPDADERPARAGILEVGISEIAFVDDAIAFDG
jgi:hypothetical protein